MKQTNEAEAMVCCVMIAAYLRAAHAVRYPKDGSTIHAYQAMRILKDEHAVNWLIKVGVVAPWEA